MKNIPIAIFLSSMFLFSCGGSEVGNATDTLKSDFMTKLSNTYWEKECSAYSKFSSDEFKTLWNTKIKLSINSSLEATYRTEYFHPNDKECNSMMFDSFDISKFEFTGKVISDESIEAKGLNETFIFNSNNRDLPPSYTLIYLDGEKLYFGQRSGSHLGETSKTRHSSISIDDYFIQILN